MSRNGRSLEFESHFQEVASGGFQAGCDPKQKTHTLQGLALATFEKGVKVAGSNRCIYTPSWGGDFESELIYVPKKANQEKIVTPWMIELHGPHRDLSIFDDEKYLMFFSSGVIINGEHLPERKLIVDSKESVSTAREFVTVAIQAFFDTPPQVAKLTPGSGQV